MLNPREAVRNLPSYHPPLAGREGLRLRLQREHVGCSPRVLERLRSSAPKSLRAIPNASRWKRPWRAFLSCDPRNLAHQWCR